MKQRSCPSGKDFCFDYGKCEDCEWGKIIEQNKKLKKKNKTLKERLSKAEARLKELEN